jgi:serine/threonine protein kinase
MSSSQTSTSISESSDENNSQDENLELSHKILNHYNILYELGRGAYSIVWLAYNINTQKFYALKVQNPTEYKDGVDEINFVKKLPEKPDVFNNLYEKFIEIIDDEKYLCSVWQLHCSNLDHLIRKGKFKGGIPFDNAINIIRQLITAVDILHTRYNVFHGDIKTDNILVKGINNRDELIIKEYIKENFNEKYINAKKEFWINKGNKLSNIDKIKKKDKIKIRKQLHKEICGKILNKIEDLDILKHQIDDKYLGKINISLADFGTYCSQDNYYDKPFGTRYYQAPEIILMGKCSYPVDIWALGCTIYEILFGEILFDPNKDSKRSRDYYHLCLINDTCGNFPSHFLKKTKYYKNYFNSKHNIIDYEKKISNKIFDKTNMLEISKEQKIKINELLTNMLIIDPEKRITINNIIKSF